VVRPPAGRYRRVGLLGGSFNPAHGGHLHISVLALQLLDLDQIWWLVSPQNPLKPVDGIDGAVEHIARFGSHHTDAIITENKATAERFLREVDSAIVLVNASTQFADGGEFGMGVEIGISTQRLPPRGPVGAEQLTTYKYLMRGTGQVRP